MAKKGKIKPFQHPIIDIYLNEGEAAIIGDLTAFFKEKMFECPHCGGLVPELRLHRGETMLTFTCIEVQKTAALTDTEGPNVLQETNYEKFCYFLLKHGNGPKSLDELMKYLDSQTKDIKT